YLQNIPMIARISAVSGHMQVGALFMLPLFHPVLLAEQVATLDVICEGRFTLKTAGGAQQDAHAAFGIPWKERAGRFEECLEIMRKLWTSDNVTHGGKYWQFANVTINPKPVQRPLPVWLGGDADRPVRRAARLVDGWLIAPWLSLLHGEDRPGVHRKALQEIRGPASELPIHRNIYDASDLATPK